MSVKSFTYIDLFAGAGGLSEGFLRNDFTPIAHVEMNKFACDTLKTRVAYHYLKNYGGFGNYIKYLKKEISRDELWSNVPKSELDSVIQSEISSNGYAEQIVPVIYKLNGWYFGNLLIGGFLGMLIIDPATGAMWKLDTPPISVSLNKPTASIEPTLQILDIRNASADVKALMVRIK